MLPGVDQELDDIFAAWDTTPRDDEAVRAMADTFVAAHSSDFDTLRTFGEDQDACIKSLEVFRAAGYEREWRLVQVWLWHRFARQVIGGVADAVLRTPGTVG